MNRNAWIVMLVLAAILPVAGDALADRPTWKPNGNAVACERWDGGARVRCGASGAGSIVLTVTADQPVQFSYDEYHSLCGSASRIVQSDTLTVSKGNPVIFRMLAAGSGVTCREVFVTTCRVDGREKPCADVLNGSYQWFKGNLQ